MIHFLVAAGPSPAIERCAPRLGPALERSRIMDGEVTFVRSPTGFWALAAVEAPDPLVERRLVVDGDAFLAVNGPAISSLPDGVAEAALAAYRRGGGASLDASLHGNWNVVASAPGRGLIALSDFSSTYPLYWRSVDGVVFVANRSSTLGQLDDAPGWDLGAMSWTLGLNRHYGEAMPARGARHLRSDDELRLPDGAGSPHLGPAPRTVWPGPDAAPGRDDLSPAEWDEVTDQLVASVRPLGGIDAPMDLMLTGGKDSRLCLALAKGAGILDQVRLVTSGGPDSPEVAAAMEVARAVGCSHHRADARAASVVTTYEAPVPAHDGGGGASSERSHTPPGRGAPEAHRPSQPAQRPGGRTGSGRRRRSQPPWQRDMAQVWQRLREGVHRYDAGISLWDGVTAPHDGPARVVIKGFGGELYRTHQTIDDGRPPRRAGWLQLLRFEQRQNPLGIVRADVAAGHSDWLSDFARDARRRTRPDLVPDLLRAVYVQGHWNGLMGQCTPGLVQVNPLLTPDGVAANARLNGPARHRERLHHEVMRRLAPELVEIPFYGSRWRPSLRRQAELAAAGRRATPRQRLVFEALVAKDRLRNFERLAALTPGMQKPVRLLQKRRPSWGPPDKALLSWQWRFLASEGEAIVALCERAGRDGGLAELCDMDRLLALARTSASIAEPIEARSVLSAVTTSLALLGEQERVTDHIWS